MWPSLKTRTAKDLIRTENLNCATCHVEVKTLSKASSKKNRPNRSKNAERRLQFEAENWHVAGHLASNFKDKIKNNKYQIS